MKFNICNKQSGVDLGDYEGSNEAAALDAMAKDAGYKNFRASCSISDPKDLDEEVERQMADLIVTKVD